MYILCIQKNRTLLIQTKCHALKIKIPILNQNKRKRKKSNDFPWNSFFLPNQTIKPGTSKIDNYYIIRSDIKTKGVKISTELR